MPTKKRTESPAIKAAKKAARESKLEQRARLIGAGIEVPAVKRRNKYNRVKATYDGGKYDSLGEAEFAHKLVLRERSGEISGWSRPKPFVLLDAPTPRGRVTYQPDFEVIPINGPRYYIDYKGSKATETTTFRIKVKMWAQKIGYELRVAYPSGEEKVVARAYQSG